MTKKELQTVKQYIHALITNQKTLYEAYTKPSSRKIAIWEYIKNECAENGGNGLTITGHNCNFFSCGYRIVDYKYVTIVYYTYANKYVIRIPDYEYLKMVENYK